MDWRVSDISARLKNPDFSKKKKKKKSNSWPYLKVTS